MAFAVGDAVAIRGYGSGNLPKQRVAAVTKTSVTLDNGSKWTVRGRPWGSSRDSWSRGWIEAWEERHDEMLAEDQRIVAERVVRLKIEATLHNRPDLARMKRALAILTGEAE